MITVLTRHLNLDVHPEKSGKGLTLGFLFPQQTLYHLRVLTSLPDLDPPALQVNATFQCAECRQKFDSEKASSEGADVAQPKSTTSTETGWNGLKQVELARKPSSDGSESFVWIEADF